MTTKKDIMTDPILKKGHKHKLKEVVPAICSSCKGTGLIHSNIECHACDGEGEVYIIEESNG